MAEKNTSKSGRRKRVVFVGDSRARAWPPPAGLDAYTFANCAVDGHTTVQTVLRLNADVAPLNPDALVVQVGVNDLVTISLMPARRDQIVADACANIGAIVKRARNLDARVVLTTIFPAGRVPLHRRAFWSADVPDAIEEVNAFIHSLEGDGVVVFDTGSILASTDGRTRPEYARDELHLNERGYMALNHALGPILRSLSWVHR